MDASTFTAEEALRLFESGPTVVFKWKAADQWPVEYVSPNVDQFGYAPADFTGGKRPYAAIVHPEDLPRVSEEVAEYARSGVQHFEQDYRIFDARGQVRYVYDFTVVRRDERGTITHYYGYVVDVTARRQAQETARESSAKYKAIVEAYDGLIYICSKDFKVEFMNRRLIERTGYDGTGQVCYKVLHNRDSICPWCVNDTVFDGRPVRWELLSPKDNRWYFVVNVPLIHPDGRLSKMAMIQDITERKQSEALARRREAILEAIGFASQQLLKSPALEHCIRDVLERIGQSLGASRIAFYEVLESPDGEAVAERRHEWAALGVAPQLYNPSWTPLRLRAQGFVRWLERLGQGQMLWSRSQECPAAEEALLKAHQVGAIALLPIFAASQWRGFLACEAVAPDFTLSPVEMEGLKTIADLLGAAMERQRTEQSLRRSEERNTTLLNALPDLMLRFDRSGTVMDLKSVPGLDLPPRAMVVGRKLRDIFPAPVARQFMETFSRLSKSGGLQVFTTPLRAASTHTYEVRMVPGAKGEGLAIVRDMTANKKAEEAIAKLAAFPLNNPSPLFEFSADGHVVFCNQAASRLAEELGLKEPAALLPSGMRERIQTCLADGKTVRNLQAEVNGRRLNWFFIPLPESRTVHGYGYDLHPG